MKWGLVVVGVVLVAVAGFFAFNNFIYNEKQADAPEANTVDMNTEPREQFTVTPITHASMVLTLGGQVIFNDPTGGAEKYSSFGEPNIILISDIHGDHLDPETLQGITTERVTIIVPQAVADELPESLPGSVVVLENGKGISQEGINIQAVPMYNVPESADSRHTKGRGNGYILEANGQRIYIAGDTGPTEEMKALQDINVAFVPMNPPFTMTVEEAADAVIAFKPETVYPYHYRGQEGLSDTAQFKTLVEEGDPTIQVELLNFYPEE